MARCPNQKKENDMATMRSAARRTPPTPAAAPRPVADADDSTRRLRSAAARARGEATVKHEEGKRTMTSSAYGQEQEQTEVVANKQFHDGEEPAFVRVALGKTISLG